MHERDPRREEKATLRRQMRAAREVFPPTSITPPTEIAERLQRPGIIASYLPMGNEPDPAPIVAAALAAGWRHAVPHVVKRELPMRFLEWRPGDPVALGPMRLRQPLADAPELAPDIILTPLVAFDRALNRLGQGAGFYDRAFAALPSALRVGIAWSIQEVPGLPVDEWDMPLHGVVTERGWIGPEPL